MTITDAFNLLYDAVYYFVSLNAQGSFECAETAVVENRRQTQRSAVRSYATSVSEGPCVSSRFHSKLGNGIPVFAKLNSGRVEAIRRFTSLFYAQSKLLMSQHCCHDCVH